VEPRAFPPNNNADIQKVFTYLVNMLNGPPVKALMSPEVAGSIWKENVKIADENNHPGKPGDPESGKQGKAGDVEPEVKLLGRRAGCLL